MGMFISAVFIIALNWKQPKGPSIAEWINELRNRHMIKYRTAMIINY